MNDASSHSPFHAIKSEQWRIRLRAVSALSEVRTAEAVALLITALKDENELVSKEAISALGNIGPLAKEAVPELIGKFLSKDPEVKKSVVYTIGKMGPAAIEALPVLIDSLASPSAELRSALSWALSMFAGEALHALISGLQDESKFIRAGLADALGRAALDAERTVPALISLLSDTEVEVRACAAKALGNMRASKKAEESVPPLIALLKDQDNDVAWIAAEALRKIGTEEASKAWAEFEPDSSVTKLAKQLKNKDRAIRIDAAKGLKENYKEAVLVLDDLVLALQDQYPEVLINATEALGRIGAASRSTIPALAPLLQHEDHRVRKQVASALGKIAEHTQDGTASRALLPVLKDPVADVRMAAGVALEEIGGETAEVALKTFKWE